jgi:predicted nucleic acid-binding protein
VVIVLDSSAAVDLLLGFPERREWVLDQLAGSGGDLHAPHVLDVEVFGVIRRLVLVGDVTVRRGRQALTALTDLALVRYPHRELLPRMWELRNSVSAPDAAFVALAEALDAPLITTDGPLARAHGHQATVIGFPGL